MARGGKGSQGSGDSNGVLLSSDRGAGPRHDLSKLTADVPVLRCELLLDVTVRPSVHQSALQLFTTRATDLLDALIPSHTPTIQPTLAISSLTSLSSATHNQGCPTSNNTRLDDRQTTATARDRY